MKTQSFKLGRSVCALAVIAVVGFASTGQALTFNISSTGNANADTGFAAAAQLWQNIFSDPVTVNINAGFAVLPVGVLGSAGSTAFNTTYGGPGGHLAAITADQTSADDATAVANLPVGPTYSKLINRTLNSPAGANSPIPYLQPQITAMGMTNGNAKALGLLAGNAVAQDAAITFSSLFAWDFNPNDGIGAGLIDFVGVAAHELGHAMGFTSGVDILDINNPLSIPPNAAGPLPDFNFDPFATPLDFYRNSSVSAAAGADMDWTVDTRKKDYSFDNRANLLGDFSTGVNFGDGRQASHWKDNPPQQGIMDPTSVPAGSANAISAQDIQAFDVIGWDLRTTVIPLPAAAWMGLPMLGIVVLVRKYRRAA